MAAIAEAVKHMMKAGMDPDDICLAIADMESAMEPDTRTARQKRNARYYQSHASEKRLKASEQDVSDAVSPDKEKVEPKEINPSKENPPKGGQKKNPRLALMAVLSEADAGAVLEHRKSLRKPLSTRAAELLAAKFAAAPTTCGFEPDQAANFMIEKGWASFEPAWALNAKPPSSPPKLVVDDGVWLSRMKFARSRGVWETPAWGPQPGLEGCLVPVQLLEPSDGKGWQEWTRERAA